PAGFASPGSPLPAEGESAPVGYSPDPAYWGASSNPGQGGGQGGGPAGGPVGTAAVKALASPTGGQLSGGLFQILPSGKTTVPSDNLVNQVISFDLDHGNSPTTPIVLHGKGHLTNKDVVKVTVHSTIGFDATLLNLKTVRLGDGHDDGAKPY